MTSGQRRGPKRKRGRCSSGAIRCVNVLSNLRKNTTSYSIGTQKFPYYLQTSHDFCCVTRKHGASPELLRSIHGGRTIAPNIEVSLQSMKSPGSTSRLRELLNKFEGVRPPSPPKKERIVSGLDPKRGPLSKEAVSAREASQNRLSSRSAEAEEAAHPKRYIPRIAATDSDEVRDLKRAILAKEQEITGVCTQLKSIADRIDRALEIFLASEIENEEQSTEERKPDQRVKAFTVDATKAVEGVIEKPKKQAVGSSTTSLEAILAAARGGQPRTGGEKPKYSKLLRDMK
ncbi:hypothetical protein FGB62_327g010 [Gracilaria domingensis]|nr:hypothetical protein FGB62_327g010 [Gracilaria domingensis]